MSRCWRMFPRVPIWLLSTESPGQTDPRFSGTPLGYLPWHPPAGGVLLRGLGKPLRIVCV